MNRKIWYTIKRLIPVRHYHQIFKTYYNFISLFYIGNLVFCPCCGKSFRKFRPHGTCGECPKCGSKEIHRLLALYLINNTELIKGPFRILHTAPEYSLQLFLSRNKLLDYVSIDLNSQRAHLKMDLTDLKFPDSSFDVILSCNVLEHIENDDKAMAEILRVMKPGAWAIIQVPVNFSNENTFQDDTINTGKLRKKYYGHHDHKRLYGKDFSDKLTATGFGVEKIAYPTEFSESEIKKYGLRKTTIIYRCSKPDKD